MSNLLLLILNCCLCKHENPILGINSSLSVGKFLVGYSFPLVDVCNIIFPWDINHT